MTSRASATCERSDGRDLAQWRVALASVLQYGAVSVLRDGLGLVSMTALE